ncbi:UbiA family prenyltransferase [Teredinibacter turnerae]|uniref:UbiA family prenyltransferase n=1 Tax=Teredinibacter turnerae TaxID=2426 RepID=UPI0030CF15EB
MIDSRDQTPLLVDLDGSLICTDSLHETAMLLLKNKPWLIIHMVFWLMAGKQVLKGKLYRYTQLNVEALPYREEVVAYLKEEHQKGRQLILCTGTWFKLAEKIAENLGVFSGVVATDEQVNLTGKYKAKYALDTYGDKGFAYLGNSSPDLHVWQYAKSAVVVGGESLAAKARKVCEVEKVITPSKLTLKVLLKAIRIHQWAKNGLLFVPLLMAHKIDSLQSITDVICAFIAFGLCASSTYLFNDLLDLEADRKHHTKCKRPLASGVLPIPEGIMLCAGLMLAGIVIALTVNLHFIYVLAAYLFITVFYSFKLKKLQTVDVIVLASLFTIRVIAGGVAAGVELTFWLLSFSMFLFLSLAIVKRVSELINTAKNQTAEATDKQILGRGYYQSDMEILQSLGGSAGFLAVLVMAFYINSDDVIQLYSHPQVLWLICPVIGYWIMRIWMLTARGQMNEDPISFAIKDQNSWYAGAVLIVILITAGML